MNAIPHAVHDVSCPAVRTEGARTDIWNNPDKRHLYKITWLGTGDKRFSDVELTLVGVRAISVNDELIKSLTMTYAAC
jgi:hypothetical protein